MIIHAFICSLLIVTGQAFWKVAIEKSGGLAQIQPPYIKSIFLLLISPYMLSGIIIYLGATIYWMYLLGKFEYSSVYPTLISFACFNAMILGVLFFRESVTILKCIGVLLIISGIYLIVKK